MSGVWNVWVTNLAKTTDIPDAYILPFASPEQLGGVKPVAKTDVMTQEVGVDSNGGLYTEPDSVYYIDLEGTFPNFTTSKTNAEIHSAYQSGRTLVCRFYQDDNRWTLPLLSPTLGLWLFGAVISTGKPVDVDAAQRIAAIVGNGQGIVTQVDLATKADIPTALPNPNALTIKVGDTTTTYDGSAAKTVEVPTKTSELTNDSNFITSSYVDTKVASLVDSAPETLDTLKELSAALGDDPNFATTISNQIGNKADKAQVLNITLAPASWTTSGNEFKYTYSNTSLRALASPIITCTSNTSEYKYITDAEATANTGIIFTAKTKPTNNIILQIIDLG